jgi:hypothetical protein
MPDIEWSVAEAVLALLISAKAAPDDRALFVAEQAAVHRHSTARHHDDFRDDVVAAIRAAREAAERQQPDARELLQLAIIKTDAWRRARR